MTIFKQHTIPYYGIFESKSNPACNVSVHGNVLGQVQLFVYLGSLFIQMQEVIRRSGEELGLQNPPLHQ